MLYNDVVKKYFKNKLGDETFLFKTNIAGCDHATVNRHDAEAWLKNMYKTILN